MSEQKSINRDGLLQVINLVKPALASQSFIAALTHVCFSDGEATAYNDISSISVRTSIDLEACVPGEMMFKALSSLPTSEILITPNEVGIVLSAGRSKLKLPTLPVSDFPLYMEALDGKTLATVTITDEILKGIELCLISIGTDPNHPAQMGVTLEEGGVLYSTDNYTLSRYRTQSEVSLPAGSPIILPSFFCNQLITLSRAFPDDIITLHIKPGAVVARFGEQASLFSKMLVDLEPLDFGRILDRHSVDSQFSNQVKDIPDQFEAAFGRALLVLSNETDKTTRIRVKRGKLSMFSESSYGTAEDSMDLKGKGEDDKEDFYTDPSLINRASKLCSKIALLEKVIVLSNHDESFTHIIAHCSSK